MGIAPYRYARDGIRRRVSALSLFIYREVLDAVRRGLRTGIPAYSHSIDGMRRTVRATRLSSGSLRDWVRRGVRTAIPASRYTRDGMRRTVGVTSFTYACSRDRVGRRIRTSIPAYRHGLDGTRRGFRAPIPFIHRSVHDRVRPGARTSIPLYRHTRDGMRRGVRATVPFTHRGVIEGARRGVRATIPGYRHLLDVARAGVGATISFPSFRYGIIGLAALAVLAPLCLVLYQSFLTAPLSHSNARLGLVAYQSVFADTDFRLAFGTTLLLAAGTTLIAVPLGAVLAFLMMRTDVPGRHWLGPLILLPIFFPALVLGFGYVEGLGPAGILSTAFRRWTGVVPWNVHSFPFLLMMAGLTHVPHAYLCMAAGLRDIGADGEETARICGAGPWKVAFGMSLPMATPAILLAIALVFFLGFELFGLPLVLGDGHDMLVVSTYLFKLASELGTPPAQPTAVVIVIMLAAGLPFLFTQRAIPVARWGILSGGPANRPAFAPFRLGLWRVPIFLAIVLWLAGTVLVPIGVLALRSFTTTWGEGMALSQALTFEHYRELLDYPNVIRSIVNTLGIGLLGGGAAAALYTALVLAIHRWHRAWSRVIGHLVRLPRALPGLAAGLALLWVLLSFGLLTPLHGTLVSVWLAYTIVCLSYGTQLISSAARKVDRQLEDIARTVGATEARMKLNITLPLMRNDLLAGWLLIFLLFAQDYSTGIYLLGSGNEVIGPLLVSLWGSGALDVVSALSVIIVIMIGVGLFIAARLGAHLHA
jgi:iron(III) transport system permease protein